MTSIQASRHILKKLTLIGILRRFTDAQDLHRARWALESSSPVLQCVRDVGVALATHHGLKPIGKPWENADHSWTKDRIVLDAERLFGMPIYTRIILFAFLLPDIDATTLIRVVPIRGITQTPTKLVRDGLLSEHRVGRILRFRVTLSPQCSLEHKALLNALVDSMPDIRAEASAADRIRRVGSARKAYAKHLENLRIED